jgi:hypothetical protein
MGRAVSASRSRPSPKRSPTSISRRSRGGATAKLLTRDEAQRIAAKRQNLSAGTALITAGVAALGAEAVARLWAKRSSSSVDKGCYVHHGLSNPGAQKVATGFSESSEGILGEGWLANSDVAAASHEVS